MVMATRVLESYYVLKHEEGYLVRIAQRADIDFLVDQRWKEAMRFQSRGHANDLCTMMMGKASTKTEFEFWESMEPRHIKVIIG